MNPEEIQERRSYIKVPKWTWPLFLAGAAALFGLGAYVERNFYSVPTCGRIVDINCDGKPDKVEIKREFQRREGDVMFL